MDSSPSVTEPTRNRIMIPPVPLFSACPHLQPTGKIPTKSFVNAECGAPPSDDLNSDRSKVSLTAHRRDGSLALMAIRCVECAIHPNLQRDRTAPRRWKSLSQWSRFPEALKIPTRPGCQHGGEREADEVTNIVVQQDTLLAHRVNKQPQWAVLRQFRGYVARIASLFGLMVLTAVSIQAQQFTTPIATCRSPQAQSRPS